MPLKIGKFTMIPSKFFGSGTAARIGPSVSLIYLALCEHANRNGDNSFKASDRALASETGLSPRTICDARKALCEAGLITVSRDKGQSYTYSLSLLELSWIKLEDRLRPKKRPRAYYASRLGKQGPQDAHGKVC